jgi:hypothetical protein
MTVRSSSQIHRISSMFDDYNFERRRREPYESF